MRKRFVKLLLFKVDTQYRLLYGFSSETEQSSYPWKTFPADRKGQKLIAKAILSPSEADNFLISLTGTEPIMLCERVTLKSPQLYKREQLLYSDDEEQQAVPISEFCYLFEFWNREKLSLLSEIQNEFSADGRTRYEQTLELLEWAKCNCGIDFCIDGRRFGNYEVYYRTPENSSFEIDIHKDQGLRVTTIRKCKDFAEDDHLDRAIRWKLHRNASSRRSRKLRLSGFLNRSGFLLRMLTCASHSLGNGCSNPSITILGSMDTKESPQKIRALTSG